MYEDLIPPLIFLLFLTFILVVPVLLWRGFRKIADPVPCWLPVVPVVVILLAMAGLIMSGFLGRGSSMAGTVIMFSLMLLLTTLAVVTPYLWFGNKTGITRPWGIFSLLSFLGVFMMFWSTMGESREGGPLPGFSLLLPLTGWIFDLLAAVLGLKDIIYSAALPIHTLLLSFGLYLEVLIVAGLFFALMSFLPRAKNE